MPGTRELLLQTRDQLDERETTSQWQDYQLRRWLNEAQFDLIARLPGKFPELVTESTGTTVDGTSDYVMSSDFLTLVGAHLNNVPCRTISRAEALSTVGASYHFGPTVNDPEVEVIDNENIRFYPTPGSTTPPYGYFYVKRPHDLSQSVSANGICTFEYPETWSGSNVAVSTDSTSIANSEGEDTTQGITLDDSGGAGTTTATWTPTTNLDLGDDTSDVIRLFVYTTSLTNVTSVDIEFHTTDGSAYYAESFAAANLQTGGIYLRAPKSEFTTTGSPSWADIDVVKILMVHSGVTAVVFFDDIGIYRTPEIDPILHPLLTTYACWKALANDEGWREMGDPANVFAAYLEQVKGYQV